MAMGTRRKRQRQHELSVAASDLPTTAAHPFYERLNALLDEHHFDAFVEGLCQPFYAATIGRPSVAGRRRTAVGRRRHSSDDRWRSGPLAVTTTRRLLTHSWIADVDTLERAVERFNADVSLKNDCQVAFVEIARDGDLHVNVTHRYPTRAVSRWAGPARVAAGFVRNRTFDGSQPRQMLRRIRDAVFAERI